MLDGDFLEYGTAHTYGRRMVRRASIWPAWRRALRHAAAARGRCLAAPPCTNAASCCRYTALAPVLAYHEHLCREVPDFEAGTADAAAGQRAWLRSLHRVLSLMTEEFGPRVRSIAAGTAAGGPHAAFK